MRINCPNCRQSMETPDEIASRDVPCPACGQRVRPPTPAAKAPRTSGLAVASLVLGILGLLIGWACLGMFLVLGMSLFELLIAWVCLGACVVPAILLGHIALSRIRRNPREQTGKGLARAALLLGYASLIPAIIPSAKLVNARFSPPSLNETDPHETIADSLPDGDPLKSAQRLEKAGQHLNALLQLAQALPEDKQSITPEDIAIRRAMGQLLKRMPVAPALPEEARRKAVQADELIKKGDFAGAASSYGDAIRLAPYMALLHYNLAKLQIKNLASVDENNRTDAVAGAIKSLEAYLDLAPDAPDARTVKDEIYRLELTAGKP